MSDVRNATLLRDIGLHLVPLLSVVVLILMMAVPTGVPPMMRIGGVWPMMGIAFWTLARPRNMSVPTVFALGLLTDIVTFVPFGVHGFVFIIATATLTKQRRFLLGQNFWMLWVAYALLALGAYTLLYVLISLFQPGSAPYLSGLIGVVLAWGCLPLVVWVLGRLHAMMILFDEPVL